MFSACLMFRYPNDNKPRQPGRPRRNATRPVEASPRPKAQAALYEGRGVSRADDSGGTGRVPSDHRYVAAKVYDNL